MRKEKPTKYLGQFTLLLVVLLAGFYYPWLTNQQSFYQSDLSYYFQPFSNFITGAFKQGRLPLWNPYLYCGMSQIAVPSPGPFYPPILLFMAMPFSQAVACYMLGHQLVAGIGAFLLVASLGWGAFAAAICGLALALCNYMFAFTVNYTLMATIVWLPLLLFALRAIEPSWSRQNVLRIAGASVTMFMMVAVGRPEISAPASLLAAGYIVVISFTACLQDRLIRPPLVNAGLRLLALIAGGCLAAPVILPALEWMRLSPRSHGLDLQWVLMWSANWYDCLGMLFAQPLGDLTILGSKFLNLAASRPSSLPFLSSAYLGPVVFTLALWGMFDRSWRWRFWVIAIFAVSLIMALGNYTPVAPFICKLSPALASFRYPIKLMIFPILALCFAAARGAYLAEDRLASRPAQLASAIVWCLAALTGLLFFFSPDLCRLTAHFPWLQGTAIDMQLMHSAQVSFGKSFLIGAALGALVNVNYLAYHRGILNRSIFTSLLVALLALTLVSPAVAYLRKGAPADFYRRKVALAEAVKPLIASGNSGSAESFSTRVQPLYFDPLTLGTSFLNDQKIDFQKGFYLFARQMMLQNANVDLHIPYAFGYEAAEVDSYKRLFSGAIGKSSQNRQHDPKLYKSDAPIAKFCQMTSVSTVLTQSFRNKPQTKVPLLDARYFSLIKDDPSLNVRIYRCRYVNPRVYFAGKINWSAKWNDFYSWMLDSEQLFNSTYVESAQLSGIAGNCSGGRDDGIRVRGDIGKGGSISNNADGSDSRNSCSGGRIRFVADRAEFISLSVMAPAKRLLVLCDHYYPGWICRIDDRPAPIIRVNFFARGVAIPAGQHLVTFSYEPACLRNGLYISAAVLGSLLIACLCAPRRRLAPASNVVSESWVS